MIWSASNRTMAWLRPRRTAEARRAGPVELLFWTEARSLSRVDRSKNGEGRPARRRADVGESAAEVPGPAADPGGAAAARRSSMAPFMPRAGAGPNHAMIWREPDQAMVWPGCGPA